MHQGLAIVNLDCIKILSRTVRKLFVQVFSIDVEVLLNITAIEFKINVYRTIFRLWLLSEKLLRN